MVWQWGVLVEVLYILYSAESDAIRGVRVCAEHEGWANEEFAIAIVELVGGLGEFGVFLVGEMEKRELVGVRW